MTNDELKKLRASYEWYNDFVQSDIEELFNYTQSLIDELAEEVELRESLEESLSEAQDEIVRLQDKLTTDFDEWEC